MGVGVETQQQIGTFYKSGKDKAVKREKWVLPWLHMGHIQLASNPHSPIDHQAIISLSEFGKLLADCLYAQAAVSLHFNLGILSINANWMALQ